MHAPGVVLWGGKWKKIKRFRHPNVHMVAFSPNERYMVTFSEIPPERDNPDDPQAIAVWDVITGQRLRGFRKIDDSWSIVLAACILIRIPSQFIVGPLSSGLLMTSTSRGSGMAFFTSTKRLPWNSLMYLPVLSFSCSAFPKSLGDLFTLLGTYKEREIETFPCGALQVLIPVALN